MSDLSKQREHMWLSALRQVGQHFSKIGDIILKCAEDTENLTGTERGRAYPSQQKSSLERGTRDEHRRRKSDEPRGTPSPAYKPVTGGPLSHGRAKYASPKDTGREPQKPDSRNGRVSMGQRAEEDDDDDDNETLSQRFRGRKRSAPGSGDRQSYEERQRRDSGHYPMSRSRALRPMKRVRMNWTDAENNTFFDTIRRYATEDDNSVLHKVVGALGGSRTLIQCKGHFRNMLVVGKVIQSETEPRRWIVVDEPIEQKRASLGGRSIHTDSKNSRSSAASREDPATGNREQDNADDARLRGARSDDRGQNSHHDGKPLDEEDDVVLDDIEDDDERDKDYQDEEGMDEEDGDGEENESGTNNTAVRVTNVGDIDPGGAGADYEDPGLGSSVRNIDDSTGKTSSMPLKKQPGGRVGEVNAARSLDDRKDLR